MTTDTTAWAEETWTYLGLRVGDDDKRKHGWLDQNGDPHKYPDTGSFVIGGLYSVRVDRRVKALTRSKPHYTGRRNEDLDRASLETEDMFARAELSRLARERADKDDKVLDDLIEPLTEIARKLRTAAERDLFTAYVIRKINRPWQ